MQRPRTLGELKRTNYRSVGVKEEMRANLLRKLASDETIFPGIIGFDDTVVPQICNAILSRHLLPEAGWLPHPSGQPGSTAPPSGRRS